MQSRPPIGHFVLADISGFTAYLAGVELDHANGVLRDLLELIVADLAPPLSLASVEGDAVFAYLPASRLSRGETLLEIFESAYRRFRVHQESIARRTTCGCKACRQIPDLDLKFLVHSGEYRLGRIAGRQEPLGLAPDLVRSRAIKPPSDDGEPHGRSLTSGYALFTSESLTRMGLPPESLGGAREDILANGAGRLEAYRLDLRARYDTLHENRRAFVTVEAADGAVTRDLPAAPAVVWEWLNDPARRSRWTAGRHWHAGERPAGRTAPGARNHCDHGLGAAIETVLDWQPFDNFTVELVQRGGGPVVHQTFQLEPLAGGQHTRLHCQIQFQPPLPRWLARPLGLLGGRPVLKRDLQRLAQLIAVDERAGQAEPAGDSQSAS